MLPLCLCLAATLLAAACTAPDSPARVRSMYYWSTVMRMDSARLSFLADHHITRLYVRFFDVVPDADGAGTPNATIRFESLPPEDVEIIPTIFITNDCLRGDTARLAKRIMKRVGQMCQTHDLGDVRELQIDCDWTPQTRQRYFSLLASLRQMAHTQRMALSVTIRLHQLSQSPPPADSGVLMMYNTGDHTDIDCEHPILDTNTALPYLKDLRGYDLPLSTAYPLYGWDIVFRQRRFVGIRHYDGELPIMPGDTIVRRQPQLSEILQAKRLVGQRRSSANEEVILFDLSPANVERFKHDDYEKIFNQ